MRSARRSGGIPRACNSSLSQPMPTPNTKRPCDSRSTLATSLAVCSGWRSGTRQIPVPSLMRREWAAAKVRAVKGSRKSACSAPIRRCHCRDSASGRRRSSNNTTCSGAHRMAKPTSSAWCAICAMRSGCAVRPMPIEKRPISTLHLPFSWGLGPRCCGVCWCQYPMVIQCQPQ